MAIELTQIGEVRSPVKTKDSMPALGVDACIVIDEAYLPALEGIEDNTHYIILFWFDQADRSILKVSPRRKKDLPPKGVFSLRAPVRPNPIGLCISKLQKFESDRLYFDHIDAVDGTPVVDIKPYLSGWDLIFSARNYGERDLYDRMDDKDLYEDLCRQAINFHGSLCVGGGIGARAVMALIKELRKEEAQLEAFPTRRLGPKDRDIIIEANARSCTLDAIQALTGARHKRFFIKGEENTVTFLTPGRTIKIILPEKKIKNLQELESLDDKDLFNIEVSLRDHDQSGSR